MYQYYFDIKYKSKKIIIKQLKSLIIYHLMDGFLGKSIKVRRIGLQILNFIILI